MKNAEHEQIIGRIAEHLKFHDREYFGLSITLGSLKVKLANAGMPVPDGVSVNRICREVCKFYRNPTYRKTSRRPMAINHNGKKWGRALGWVEKHKGEIDLYLDTDASVARLMRYAGVSMNAPSAHESLKSHGITLTGNPRKQEAAAQKVA